MKNFLVLCLTSLVFCLSLFSSFTVHGGLVSKPTTELKHSQSFIDYSISSMVSNYASSSINSSYDVENIDFLSTSLGEVKTASIEIVESSIGHKALDSAAFSATTSPQTTSPGLFSFILFFLAMAGIVSRQWIAPKEP